MADAKNMRKVLGFVAFLERRDEVKKLKILGIMGAVLLLGLSALGACPPGSIPLVAGANNINAPGVYCAPLAITSGPITINANDVTIVGETPQARVTSVTLGANAQMNIVLKDFTIVAGGFIDTTANVNPMNFVIEGITFAASPAGGAIRLRGIEPIVRNCVFIDPPAGPIIELRDGYGAKIYGNRVSDSTVDQNQFVQLAVNYNGLEVYDNEFNYIGDRFFSVGTPARTLTNGVIRDNRGGVVGTAPIGAAAIELGSSTNVQVLNNVFTYVGGGQNAIGGTGANIVVRGNRITAGASGVGDAINFTGQNWIVEENILDLRLGAGADAIQVGAGAVSPVIRGNTILGTRDGRAVNILALNARVENNVIRDVVWSAGAGAVPAAAIWVFNMNAQILNNTIENVVGASAIIVAGPANTTSTNAAIRGNVIRNVDFVLPTVAANVFPMVQGGMGVVIAGQMNALIEGNTFENVAGCGVLLIGSSNGTVAGDLLWGIGIPGPAMNNIVRGNTFRRVATRALNEAWSTAGTGQYERRFPVIGIVQNADNNTVTGNTIEDVGSSTYAVGIHVVGNLFGAAAPVPAGVLPENNVITNNTIRQLINIGDVGLYAVGILLDAGTGMNNVVEGNTISNTGNMQIGIDVRVADRAAIKENTIEGMIWAGIYVRGGTVLNRLTVEDNKLTNNHTGLRLSAGAADVLGNKVTGGQTAIMVDSFGTAPWYKVEGNCFTAPTLARNEGAGLLTAKKNFWGATPQPGVNVFGAVDTSEPLASCPGEPAPAGLTFNYGARAGWYLVSVPTFGDTGAIFGVTLYRWNGTTYDTFSGAAPLNPNHGYWARLAANTAVTATGTVPTADQAVHLTRTGWHMISVPWNYPKSAIEVIRGTETRSWADAVAAGWVSDTIWAYDGTQYVSATTLQPWYGYWVRARVDGLTLQFLYASRLTTLCASCFELVPMSVSADELPPAPPEPKALLGELKFANVPNPVTDVHTTKFVVLGPMSALVEAIKVKVFDLTGRLVWEGATSGAELVWHTDDLTGQYLANGVYLYRIEVKVLGEWVASGVLKLVINR